MYEQLRDLLERPALFSRITTKELWTRPHLARQMLRFHLDETTDLASLRPDQIDRSVDWLDQQIGLDAKKLCDLGCGPGLYALRFAEKGAAVTGIDFSRHSLEYAESTSAVSGQSIRFLLHDYLVDDLPGGFDVVTLIYQDYCALSPSDRQRLLKRIRGMLIPGGKLVLDVTGMKRFAAARESIVMEENYMGGFWAGGEYVGIHRTLIYPDDAVVLDRYLIVEPTESWQIYNWAQHYTPASITGELSGAGFRIESLAGSLAGEPLEENGDAIGVIAST